MNTKPFNLEAAMNGAKIVFGDDGIPAKFIAYVPEADEHCRVVALVRGKVFSFYENGQTFSENSRSNLLIVVQNRSINGHEYPEPERVEPGYGAPYFVPSISNRDCFVGFDWAENGNDRRMLRRGLVHLRREAAEQHAQAIILAGGGEV